MFKLNGRRFLWGSDSWRPLMLGATSLSLLMLLAIWSYVEQSLDGQERLVVENVKSAQHNLAATISENLNQLFDRGRLFGVFASKLLENSQDAFIQTRITAMLGTDQAFNQITVFDLHGQQVFSSTPARANTSLVTAVEQALRKNKLNSKSGMGFGPIPKTLNEAWHIPLLYPVLDSMGENSGILLLVLDLGYVLQLNQTLIIGNTEIINIIPMMTTIVKKATSNRVSLCLSLKSFSTACDS